MGGVASGASTPDNATKILKAALGLPIDLVSGHKGTGDIRVAAESGNVAGGCWGWDWIRATWRNGLDSGNAVVVLQAAPTVHPDLPRVPLAIHLAMTDQGRRLIEVGIHADNAIARAYTLPPGVPKARLAALRRAFQLTMRDPGFLSEAEKSRLTIDPLTGEEVERNVRLLFSLDPALLTRLKEILR